MTRQARACGEGLMDHGDWGQGGELKSVSLRSTNKKDGYYHTIHREIKTTFPQGNENPGTPGTES